MSILTSQGILTGSAAQILQTGDRRRIQPNFPITVGGQLPPIGGVLIGLPDWRGHRVSVSMEQNGYRLYLTVPGKAPIVTQIADLITPILDAVASQGY